MIVRIHASGKSFAGTAAYLTHDPDRSQTDERVAWTHTHNLANDHVPSAVDEMLWTARDAELLKQEAGIRAGGRATENPVKHLSLNWAPGENPSRGHMIETTESFLERMRWQEHQAILVAHDDKSYSHVHVLLNMVHPETGLRLDDNFERRRAQAWALDYERENGRIYCEQRLLQPDQREASPPRNVWTTFTEAEKEFARAENSLQQQEPIILDEAKSPENQKNNEWKYLRDIQKNERINWFADGKSEFRELRRAIFRETKEEFRERWANYYDATKNGGDPDALASLKAELVADQKAVLEGRRDEACRELREYRDGLYRELLDEQREVRVDLRTRQEAGLDNTDFLRSLGGQEAPDDVRAAFREAAEATTRPADGARDAGEEGNQQEPAAPAAGASAGGPPFVMGAFTLFDSLLSIFEGPSPGPPPPSASELMQRAAEDTFKREQREREEVEEESEKRQRSPTGI